LSDVFASFQSFEMLKALVFFGRKHHHGGSAVFRHRLWFAPRRLKFSASSCV
jgi:hypothetical protein